MFGVEFLAAFVLPSLTDSTRIRHRRAVGRGRGTPVGSIGLMQSVLTISGIGYMLGGPIFGIALFRLESSRGGLQRCSQSGTIGTVALAVLPESFNRFFALPSGWR